MSKMLCGLAAFLWLLVGTAPPALSAARPQDLDKIKLPPGFAISVFAADVPGARSLAQGEKGTVFVGTRDEGTVYAVVDRGEGQAPEVLTIAKGLNEPNGVAVRDGALYVAEIHRIIRFDGIEDRLRTPPRPEVVNASFPRDRAHGWKYIAFGPDGLLYVPVGFPCNICAPKDERYGTIMRMRPDGSGLEIFARGIRNTVGFDFHPRTRVLWFTNNGRDWLGDDRPPDTLNQAPKQGLDFGFPHCNAGELDPDFGAGAACGDYAPTAMALAPHAAALGMKFYTGSSFPQEYRGTVFIAEHGSWNRSVPIGYRVTAVRFTDGRPSRYEVFAEGWLQGRTAWGRPVDILVRPDGSLLVSDDKAGAIYRITYRNWQ